MLISEKIPMVAFFPCGMPSNSAIIQCMITIVFTLTNGAYQLVLQGYNRIIVFSRAFYFCVFALLLLALDHAMHDWQSVTFHLYGLPFSSAAIVVFARDLTKGTSGDSYN